ncbi:MAG: HlyC/CorC family transporter [Phycisphaerales bacterium]|nr:HlyC/CorC family transporter [Phycisphaerales bacterium]
MIGTHWLWVGLAALVIEGVLHALEFALRDLSRSTLQQVAAARRGPQGLARVERLLSDLSGHANALALIRIPLMATVCVASIRWFAGMRGADQLQWIDLGLGALIGVALLWHFGVILGDRIAFMVGERLVFACGGPLHAWYLATRPLTILTSFWGEVVRRLAGASESVEVEQIEADLRSVVDEGESAGRIDETERDMIEAVVEFRTTTVEQIMTPRIDVEALEYTDDLEAVKIYVRNAGHSRIPVFRENLDHICGVLYAKDLLHWMTDHPDDAFVLSEILRDPLFVPETKTVRELLAELLAKKVHIAMAADEYGGTSGIVTIEDMIEEIVGEIEDEYDEEEEDRPGVDVDPEGRLAIVDARLSIRDANDELEELGLELPLSEEYDTVGGYVVTSLGRIPDGGDSLVQGTTLVTVLEADPTRVRRVRVEHANGDSASES